MHPSIRASGYLPGRHDPQDCLEGLLQAAFHGRQPRLLGPAVEAGAVVLKLDPMVPLYVGLLLACSSNEECRGKNTPAPKTAATLSSPADPRRPSSP